MPESVVPDHELLEALKRDPETGARALDHAYRKRLQVFCLGYLPEAHLAEDAAQEVLLKILASPPPDTLRPWLWVVARRHCLQRRKERDRRPDDVTLASHAEFTASMTGHLTGLVEAERRARLRESLASLTDLQEEVLRLRYHAGLSREEIASTLDVEVRTVKSRLFDAMKALRARLDDTN